MTSLATEGGETRALAQNLLACSCLSQNRASPLPQRRARNYLAGMTRRRPVYSTHLSVAEKLGYSRGHPSMLRRLLCSHSLLSVKVENTRCGVDSFRSTQYVVFAFRFRLWPVIECRYWQNLEILSRLSGTFLSFHHMRFLFDLRAPSETNHGPPYLKL